MDNKYEARAVRYNFALSILHDSRKEKEKFHSARKIPPIVENRLIGKQRKRTLYFCLIFLVLNKRSVFKRK
jgi:hypothetical protein